MNLVEKYKNRVALAEKVYAEKNNGKKLDSYKKLMVAKVLDNTSKFLNEQFTNSVGFQRSELGQYKQFALNVANVALPNLIAPELVLVSPMSSWQGYVTYQMKVA